MSKVAKNGKFLNLEGVRISYRPKDNTIHLTSVDEDLEGESFHLTLKSGSPSEETIRNLLKEKGLIRAPETDHEQKPDRFIGMVPYPAKGEVPDGWNQISLGVDANGKTVGIDLLASPHTAIVGRAGVGKSIVQQTIFNHCLLNNDKIKFYGIDLTGELKKYSAYQQTTKGIAATFEEAYQLINEVSSLIQTRETEIEKLRTSLPEVLRKKTFLNFQDITPAVPAVIVVVDGLLPFLDETKKADPTLMEMTATIYEKLKTIARIGRLYGIYLVVSSQSANMTSLPFSIKRELHNQIAMGDLSQVQNDYFFSAIKTSPVTGSPTGRGIINVDGELTEFQAYYPGYDWADNWVLRNAQKEPERYQTLTHSIAQEE